METEGRKWKRASETESSKIRKNYQSAKLEENFINRERKKENLRKRDCKNKREIEKQKLQK